MNYPNKTEVGIEGQNSYTDLAVEKYEKLYLHQDRLGSTIRITRENGTTIAWADYDEWGKPRSPRDFDMNMAGVDNAIGFTSYTYDVVLDKYFAQARFYDASNRRFIQEDPIKDGLNWYAYVGNSPILFVDPLGLATCYSRGGNDAWYQEFLSGYGQGFVDYYGARWDEISAILEDPIGSYLNMVKRNVTKPWELLSLYQAISVGINYGQSLVNDFFVPLFTGDFYTVGKFIGTMHAMVLETAVIVAVANGVEAGIEKINSKLAIKNAGAAVKSIDDILEGTTPGRVTKGSSTQRIRNGSYEQALDDFNSLGLSDVKPIQNGQMGKLPDGRTVNVRLDSSYNTPTLEIFSNGKSIKIRYVD